MITSQNRFRYFTFLLFSIFCLTIGFNNNFWNAANTHWYNSHQIDSESLVIGRLIKAQHDGIFSDGGLTGYYNFKENKNKIIEWEAQLQVHAYNYNIYNNNLSVDTLEFYPYNSQIGGQAIVFSIISKFLPISNPNKLKVFKLITSILSATAVSLFLLWLFHYFGLNATLLALIFILLSQWITVFGKNLWWGLWSFYLPFLIVLYLLFLESISKIKLSTSLFFLCVFVSVFLKCFFTGYEYISTTLLAMVTPIIFYAIYNGWRSIKLIKNIFYSSLSSLMAIVSSFIVLSYQLSFVLGSFTKGINHILWSFTKQSSGDQNRIIDENYKNACEASVWTVLKYYLKGKKAFDFNNVFHTKSMYSYLSIDFIVLIILFFIFSLIILYPKLYLQKNYLIKRKNLALVITTYFSVLAPLSWFIIFKTHSYVHTEMNYVTWYIPFCLFGFGILGIVITRLIQKLKDSFK